MFTFAYELLDTVVHVRTACLATAQAAQAMVEKHTLPVLPWIPDVCLDLGEIEASSYRYLTRQLPDRAVQPLPVRYRLPGASWMQWSFLTPPLIPFCLPGLGERFLALHAAALSWADHEHGLILMGRRGAGKSSMALRLCRHRGTKLLSDENAVVDLRSLRLRALLRQPHGYVSDGQGNHAKACLRFADNPWIQVSDHVRPAWLIELVHVPGLSSPRVQRCLAPAAAVQIASCHLLAFGASNKACLQALLKLCALHPVYQIYHGGHAQFDEVERLIVHLCEKNHHDCSPSHDKS